MSEFIELDLNALLNKGSLPDPIMYQYYKNLSNNTIVINNEINDDLLEFATLPLIEMNNNPEVESINIILNTGGGEIYNGFAFIAELEKVTKPTTLRIAGMAASMGGLIAMAKNPNLKVVCDKFSVGLVHSGSQCMSGSTHAVRDTFKFSERYEEKIKDYILSHTKITEEMYKEIERQEFWLDAEDMLKYGIVDEIL